MNRHKEKDDEAGGEGLGVLATRKRLWRDADGNIVNARRPSCTQDSLKRRQISRAHRKAMRLDDNDGQMLTHHSLPSPPSSIATMRSRSSSTIIVDTTGLPYATEESQTLEEHLDLPQHQPWMQMAALPSPPMSESSLHSGSQSSPPPELNELDGLYETAWPSTLHSSLPEAHIIRRDTEPLEFMGNTNWGSQPFQTFMGAAAELPYEDIFRPEMGMYDWQQWNNQMLMSRCREEKYDVEIDSRRDWAPSYSAQSGNFYRAYGLGRC